LLCNEGVPSTDVHFIKLCLSVACMAKISRKGELQQLRLKVTDLQGYKILVVEIPHQHSECWWSLTTCRAATAVTTYPFGMRSLFVTDVTTIKDLS
jgi:hypothetical protein